MKCIFNRVFQYLIHYNSYLYIYTITIFISSNYLFVSGEHRAHLHTNVCSRFYCPAHPFQASGVPIAVSLLGSWDSILIFRQGIVPYAAVYRVSHKKLHSFSKKNYTQIWINPKEFLIECFRILKKYKHLSNYNISDL